MVVCTWHDMTCAEVYTCCPTQMLLYPAKNSLPPFLFTHAHTYTPCSTPLLLPHLSSMTLPSRSPHMADRIALRRGMQSGQPVSRRFDDDDAAVGGCGSAVDAVPLVVVALLALLEAGAVFLGGRRPPALPATTCCCACC